jgi:hypothetical protein
VSLKYKNLIKEDYRSKECGISVHDLEISILNMKIILPLSVAILDLAQSIP